MLLLSLLYPLFRQPGALEEKSVTPPESKRVKNKGRSPCEGAYRNMERSKGRQSWKRTQKYMRRKNGDGDRCQNWMDKDHKLGMGGGQAER